MKLAGIVDRDNFTMVENDIKKAIRKHFPDIKYKIDYDVEVGENTQKLL